MRTNLRPLATLFDLLLMFGRHLTLSRSGSGWLASYSTMLNVTLEIPNRHQFLLAIGIHVCRSERSHRVDCC